MSTLHDTLPVDGLRDFVKLPEADQQAILALFQKEIAQGYRMQGFYPYYDDVQTTALEALEPSYYRIRLDHPDAQLDTQSDPQRQSVPKAPKNPKTPKVIRPVHYDSDQGRWVLREPANLKKSAKPLFGLEQLWKLHTLESSSPTAPVEPPRELLETNSIFIVEGERKAQALQQLGLISLSTQGAQSHASLDFGPLHALSLPYTTILLARS